MDVQIHCNIPYNTFRHKIIALYNFTNFMKLTVENTLKNGSHSSIISDKCHSLEIEAE